MDNIDFDKEKRPQKLAKNRRMPNDPNAVKRRSTLAIRLFLKEFCVEFLHGAYNNLMSVVRDNVVRQKAQNNDETYYLWSMKFFMEFNREIKFRPDLVTETLNKSSFHFVQGQIMEYKDNYEHEKKNRPMCLIWARRMHLGKIWWFKYSSLTQGLLKLLWTVYSEGKLQSCLKSRNFQNPFNKDKSVGL